MRSPTGRAKWYEEPLKADSLEMLMAGGSLNRAMRKREIAAAKDAKRQLSKCRNPLCDRLTTAAYCCGPCAQAHEGKYEIHQDGPLGHSEPCNQRHKERS